jgi:hypothetical protein
MSISRVATARAAIAVLACAAFGVLAAPASAPHAAACVAALKAQEAGFAESVKAGEPVPAEFLRVVRSGIAIIGSQYLAGLREAEARELLRAAEGDFQALPPAQASERQDRCLREGESIFGHASPLEQNLITTAAQRRIKRLTSP